MALPAELDFAKDRSGSPERMNRAMDYLLGKLRSLEAQRPEFASAVEQLRSVGLQRVAEALTPVFLYAGQVRDDLQSIKDQWEADLLPSLVVQQAADAVVEILGWATQATLTASLAAAAASASEAGDHEAAAILAQEAAEAAASAADGFRNTASTAAAAAVAAAATFDPSAYVHTAGDQTMAGKLTAAGLIVNGQTLDQLSANGCSLIEAANYAAMRTLLGLVIGTDVQAQNAMLQALAGLSYTGNAGKVVAVNGTADGVVLVTPNVGWTQIGAINPVPGPAIDFTNIPQTYSDLLLLWDAVSTVDTGNVTLAVSANGTSFDSGNGFFSPPSAGLSYSGGLLIPSYKSNVGIMSGSFSSISADSAAPGTNAFLSWRCTGGIHGLRMKTTTGFDAGNMYLLAR